MSTTDADDTSDSLTTVGEVAAAIRDIRRRLTIVYDWHEQIARDQLKTHDARLDELEATVAELETRLADAEGRLAAHTEPAADGSSTPAVRAAALRELLVDRVQRRDDSVTLWWREVRDALCDRGFREYTKPVYYDAITDAAETYAGLEETTKTVYDEDGTEQVVTAIGADPDALPAEPPSSDATTGESGTPASAPVQTGPNETAD